MDYQLSLFAPAAGSALADDLERILPGEYAAILLAFGLDNNRQLIAARLLRDCPRPSARWFSGVCRKLMLDQAAGGPTQGMMF